MASASNFMEIPGATSSYSTSDHSGDTGHMYAGYNVAIFIIVLASKYSCAVCKRGLRRPHQSFCGHRFCERCLENLKKAGVGVVCPGCTEEDGVNEYSDLSRTFLDKAMLREMLRLAVKCIADGCTWTGVLADYDAHQDMCELCKVACPQCGAVVLEENLQGHKTEECANAPVQCLFKCETNIAKINLDKHNADNISGHLLTLLHWCVGLEKMAAQETCGDAVNLIKSKLKELESKVTEFMKRIQDFGRSTRGVNDGSGSSSHSLGGVNTPPADTQNLSTSIDRVNADVERLLGHLESKMSTLRQLQTAVVADQSKMAGMRRTMTSLQKGVAEKDEQLADMDRRMTLAELSTFNGTLVWRVTGWNRKYEDARAGRTLHVTSPPFFTTRTGYKMCLRVYPAGDGAGRGTHVSLFFIVMRGDHDAILSWPFRQKVTFKLIDQQTPGSDGRHVVECFRPDPSSSSFRRPRAETNIPAGCPMFVSHDVLHGNRYVMDDVCYFKVIVATAGI